MRFSHPHLTRIVVALSLALASQAKPSPGRIGAILAHRYRYLVNPTNPEHCKKVIDDFSQGDEKSISLPKTDDDYKWLATSDLCTLSIFASDGLGREARISQDNIVKAANKIIEGCTVDGQVAGAEYVHADDGIAGVVTLGERIHPIHNPFAGWWEETKTQLGIYKVVRTYPDHEADFGVIVYEEEFIHILDSMRELFKNSAEEKKVEYESKTWMQKDPNYVHRVKITYEAENRVDDIETEDLPLLRIFREALTSPRMDFPKFATAVVEKDGKKIGEFKIEASETSDKDGASFIGASTHSNELQAAPFFELGDDPDCVWDHWPKPLLI